MFDTIHQHVVNELKKTVCVLECETQKSTMTTEKLELQEELKAFKIYRSALLALETEIKEKFEEFEKESLTFEKK